MLACPVINDHNIQITLNEDHAMITWQITGRVTRVDILSCDADRNTSPCVNTTETNPETDVPVRVEIPPRAALYRFDLYLYDNGDLVQRYEDEEWLVVGDGSSMDFCFKFSKKKKKSQCNYKNASINESLYS